MKVVSKILYILREGSQGNRRFPAKVVYKILYSAREGGAGETVGFPAKKV